MNREDILKLPKLDLHCHLDGSLSKTFLENALGRTFTMEELSVSMDCNSLVEYLEKFDIPLEAMNTAKNIKAATVDVMKSASAGTSRGTVLALDSSTRRLRRNPAKSHSSMPSGRGAVAQ